MYFKRIFCELYNYFCYEIFEFEDSVYLILIFVLLFLLGIINIFIELNLFKRYFFFSVFLYYKLLY